MNKLRKDNKGTTLIELVIYIVIAGFVLVNTIAIMSQIIYAQNKVEIISREDENARNLMHIVSQSIEEAQIINSPNAINATASAINLTDSSNNTIIYTLTSGVVYSQINGGSQIALSSSDVYVTKFQFTVESEAGVSPSINVQLEIQQTSSNATNKTHYETTDAQRKI